MNTVNNGGGRTMMPTGADSGDRTVAAPGLLVLLGGLAWVLSTVQFALAQAGAASAWEPPYSWRNNYISDLGNTACGPFTVPHGVPEYVCSPLHGLMNSSFALAGVLTVAGAVLLHRKWPARRMTTVASGFWIIAGLGKILVGFEPENANVGLHLVGALNVPLSCVAVLLLSVTIRHDHRALSTVGIVVAGVGLAGTVLSTAGQFAGPSLYLGLGPGGMERVSDYPPGLWMLLIGTIAITSYRGTRPEPPPAVRSRPPNRPSSTPPTEVSGLQV